MRRPEGTPIGACAYGHKRAGRSTHRKIFNETIVGVMIVYIRDRGRAIDGVREITPDHWVVCEGIALRSPFSISGDIDV